MITVEITKIQGVAPPRRMLAQFGESGGTLGRSPDCTLVLPDETRTVSRVHGQIQFQDGRFRLVDQGANPIKVNGTPIGRGESAVVKAGDVVQIGGFELKVREERAREAPIPPRPPSTPVAAGGNPFDDLFGSSSGKSAASPSTGSDPFAGLGFGSSDKTPAGPASAAREDLSGPSALPGDFDPMAPPPGKDDFLPLPPAGAGLPDDAFDSLFSSPQAPGSGSLDSLFGLGADSSQDPFTSGALAKPGMSDSGSNQSGLTQWLGGIKAPIAATVPDQVPEINTPFPMPPPARRAVTPPGNDDFLTPPISVPPPLSPASESTRSAAPSPAVNAAPTGSDDLIDALLAGLNAPGLSLQGLSPELMHTLGSLVREATQGTLGLLNARGAIKREMRADVTMIASGRNNPLKFSPDVTVALRHLLGPPTPGFMSAEDAMQDAYNDLRAHEFGFMAGLRAALTGVLKRFEPQQLEARLPSHSGLNSLLPMNRRARLWDLFGELYREIAQEAEEDFHALFGREFLRAYEEHVHAVERDPKRRGT